MIEISANFTPQANPDAKKASIQHFLEYSGSAKGIVQEYRLIQRTSRVFNEARKATGLSSSKTLDVLESKFGDGWKIIGPASIPAFTLNAYNTVSDLKNETSVPGGLGRKIMKVFRDVGETLALYFNVGFFLAGNKLLGTVASFPDFVSDAADLQIAATDLHLSRMSEKKAENFPDKVKENIKHTKYHAMIRVAKAICSVVGGIFGILAFAFGIAILPLLALAVISLSSTVFSIGGHAYKVTRPYEMIDFFNPKNITVQSSLKPIIA